MMITSITLEEFYIAQSSKNITYKIYEKEKDLQLLKETIPIVLSKLEYINVYNPDSLYYLRINNKNIRIKVKDMNSKIDLGSLNNPAAQRVLYNLLGELGVNTDKLINILCFEGYKDNCGNINSYPLKLEKMSSKEELLYAGFTEKEFYKISKYVTAMNTQKININTAPLELLKALGIDESAALNIISKRKKSPFHNIEDLATIEGITLDKIYRLKDIITTKSSVIKISIKIGKEELIVKIFFDINSKRILKTEIV